MKSSLFLITITLVFISRLSISNSSSTSGDDNDDNDDYDDYDDYDARIRREIRQLSSWEWQRIANAINIMKSTSQEDGKKLYGSKFETYDSLVCRHALAVGMSDGDQGHFTSAFFLFHRALVLLFEEILILIDNKIEALPYWDYRLDAELEDLGTSVVFSDKYLGALRGDPDLGYRVTDGKFANWKVNADSSQAWQHKSHTISCPADGYVVRNPYGLLRGALNPNDEEYVTRVGGYYCGEKYKYHIGVTALWDECIETSKDIEGLDDCVVDTIHNPAHFVVGGQVPLSKINDPNSEIIPNNKCLSFITEGGDLNNADGADEKNIIQKMGYNYGCFKCPWDNDAQYTCEIGKDSIESCAQCDLTNANGECTIDELTWTISGSKQDQWIIGDFNDFLSGVNDPFWFFHHANMDKLFQEWREKQYDDGNKSPFYGFPTNGWPYGQNLNDPICGNNGCHFYDFLSQYLDGKSGPYTHKDILLVTRVNGGIIEYE